MVARSTAAYRARAVELNPVAWEAHPDTYGGLVGQLIHEIDVRMASTRASVDHTQSREDLFHIVSICAGYAGLVTGFGAVVAGIWLIL
jgi:hypothetical protein